MINEELKTKIGTSQLNMKFSLGGYKFLTELEKTKYIWLYTTKST